jgi:hypothetical protein
MKSISQLFNHKKTENLEQRNERVHPTIEYINNVLKDFVVQYKAPNQTEYGRNALLLYTVHHLKFKLSEKELKQTNYVLNSSYQEEMKKLIDKTIQETTGFASAKEAQVNAKAYFEGLTTYF